MAIKRSSLDVRGLTSTIQRLDKYSFRYNRRRIANVMRSETKGLRRDMKKHAPKDDGQLRKAIQTTTKMSVFGIHSRVGPRLKKAWYAHFVELGTKSHMIKLRPHPGTAAQPFVKPVYEANKTRLPAILYRAVKRIMNLK